MNWYENLYVGKNAQKKVSSYIQRIESGSYPVQVFLIALSSDERDQIDIFSARNLKFWYNQKKCPLIIGIAQGREEALEVLQTMTEDVLCETGDLDFRQYFNSKVNEAL